MKETAKRSIQALTLFLLLATASCYAQFTGGVQGTVQDQKGAIVPQAKVALTNVETGVTQTAVSNATGVYRFVSLAPGNYTVSTAVQGFAQASVSFNLATNEVRDVPLSLAVGKVASTVTVTTEAPLIDTSDSRFEQTLDTEALTDLPLPGRNATNVITIAPGVTGTGGQNSPGSSTSTNFAPENWVNASASGQGATGNQYIVDGMDVTSTIRRAEPYAELGCFAGGQRSDQHLFR